MFCIYLHLHDKRTLIERYLHQSFIDNYSTLNNTLKREIV